MIHDIICPCGIAVSGEDPLNYAHHYRDYHTDLKNATFKKKEGDSRTAEYGVTCGCGEVFAYFTDWAEHLDEIYKAGELRIHVLMGDTRRALS